MLANVPRCNQQHHHTARVRVQVILERLRHVRPVNASQPLEQGVNGRQVLSDVTLQQVRAAEAC
jgi:hypothetical protein